jgi:HPt (histidine-containing phosphotransfer) domain-containing protein
MALTDLAFLTNFTKGDNAKMKKYINMFLDIAPKSVAEMEQYNADKDFDRLKVVAHSLKPQVSYMGIKHLETTIKEIELFAGSKTNTESLPEKIDYFKTECAKACEELSTAAAKL